MKAIAVIVSVAGLLVSCGPGPGPEPQPEPQVVGLGVEEGEGSIVAALSDGSRVYLYGGTDPSSGSFVLESAALVPASGNVITAELDASGWPEEIVFADGAGIRLDPLVDGTVRARMWDDSGEILLDEVVEGDPSNVALQVALARGGGDVLAASRNANEAMLTVRVPVLGCDGEAAEEIVQRAQSCLVVAHGPADEFRLYRIARREAAEFVTEFPLEPQLGDLDVSACQRVVEPLAEHVERCHAVEAILEGVCLLGHANPKIELLCKAAKVFVLTMCITDEQVVESCNLPPEQRPPVPEDLSGSLRIASVQAHLRVRTCDGFVDRISNRPFVAPGQTEVEALVDGCTGTEGSISPVGVLWMSSAGIVGGSGSYEVLEFSANGGLFITEVRGTSARVTVPRTDLRECRVFSQENFEPLSTVWTRLDGSLALSAERTRGFLSATGTVTREEEVHRSPTPEEIDSYSRQIDGCIREEEHEVASGFLLIATSLMPFQRARVTVSLTGMASAKVAALGLLVEETPIEPGQTAVLEITYEQLEQIYTGSFPFDFELPPGITFPDGIQAGPCLGGFFTLVFDSSTRISTFGSYPVNARASYQIEILDE